MRSRTADYHQFYVLDSGAALDATGNADFWTPESFARMLAVNPKIIGIGTGSVGEVPVVKQWPKRNLGFG